MKKGTKEVDLKDIEQQLVKRKGELEDQLARLHKDGLPIKHSSVISPDDEMQLVMQEVLNISLHDKEFEEYKKIVKALDRIKEGDYGLCIDCGMQISPKRLTAFPDATRCIGCQELIEEVGRA